MTSDDQHFLDILGSISSDIRAFSANAFDAADKQIDSVASSLRSAFDSSSWLPWSLKSPPPPPRSIQIAASSSFLQRTVDWVSKHKAATAAIVAFAASGGVYIYYERQSRKRRRRAKRAANGARREIVVIAGPPASPITKSLMLDLEKRGFIVYVIVRTVEEEDMVTAETMGRSEIRPFMINLQEPFETEEAINRFRNLLATRQHAFNGAVPHELSFTGLVIAPDVSYTSGPIETLTPDLWSDTLASKVVAPVTIAQAFLSTICESKARLLILTPNIVSSLSPAFHGLETTIVSAINGFATTLSREMSTLGLTVSQVRLGAFDFSHVGSSRSQLATMTSSRTLSWPPSARRLYAENFMSQSEAAERSGLFSASETGSVAKATSPRELNHVVFDALTEARPKKVYRVGRGSLAYDLVGQWIPGGLVGWVLGLRKVDVEQLRGRSGARTPSLEGLHMSGTQNWEKVERERSA